MLIVLAGGLGRSLVAKHLIDNHRFVGRNTMPRTMPTPGSRVVVVPEPPTTTRERLSLARRTRRMGGMVVWLDHSECMELTLPDPLPGAFEVLDKSQKRMKAAYHEADDLVTLLAGVEHR
jgi:hypothetical protein